MHGSAGQICNANTAVSGSQIPGLAAGNRYNPWTRACYTSLVFLASLLQLLPCLPQVRLRTTEFGVAQGVQDQRGGLGEVVAKCSLKPACSRA